MPNVNVDTLKLDQKFSEAEVHALFERFDITNHNGLLSLAEIDKAIIDLWPEASQFKDAVRRAYQTSDQSNDGFITESEFSELLLYLNYYITIYQKFQQADTDNDKRITFDEFKKYHELLGVTDTDETKLKADFDAIDLNGGGMILFDEMCHSLAHKFGRPGKSLKSDLIGANRPAKKSNPAASKSPAQQRKSISKPAGNVTKSVDKKFSDEEIHDLFKQFDANNNNGLLSLAEIDKAIGDLWPEMFKFKAAIMRAYKTSDLSEDGLINESEFKELLTYLSYYVKLYQVFDQMDVDDDKRIEFSEFVKGHELVGVKSPEAELRAEFAKIDTNGGGIILFDEFCHYMADKYGRPGKSKKSDLIQSPKPAKKEAAKKAPAAQQSPKPQKAQMKPADDNNSEYGEMKVSRKWTDKEVAALFARFDATNNNGLLSLAEIDKALMDLWPELGRFKDAVRRAYVTADMSNDGFITQKEFSELLLYLSYYIEIYHRFQVLDINRDKRISVEEFVKGYHIVGLNNLSEDAIMQEFSEMDHNAGGFVLFDEFCHAMAHRFGRPGKSIKTDLIDKGVAAYKVKARTRPVAAKFSVDRNGNQVATSPKSRPHSEFVPASTAGSGISPAEIRRNSVERQLLHAKVERKRLENLVDQLRTQLQVYTTSEERSHSYLSGWQALQDKHFQLESRLASEQDRSNELQGQMFDLAEQIRQLEIRENKEFIEEAKKSNASHNLTSSREVKELKVEKAKFERLTNDTARRLAMAEERNKKMEDEIAEARRQAQAAERLNRFSEAEKRLGF